MLLVGKCTHNQLNKLYNSVFKKDISAIEIVKLGCMGPYGKESYLDLVVKEGSLSGGSCSET